MLRVHYPESEPTTHPRHPPTTGGKGDTRGSCSQQNNGSPRYGGHSGRETPGTIPTPEVKPASANGTAPERMGESRTPPNNNSPDGGHHTMAPIGYFSGYSKGIVGVRRPGHFSSSPALRASPVHSCPGQLSRVSAAPRRLGLEEVMRMSAHESQPEELNEVTLVGRLSQPAEEQVLPSGDEMWKFRVIVGRQGAAAKRASVDAWDCVVWAKRPARSVAGWRTGDVVEVGGSLRRRFFAPAGGARVSRCEVEVAAARLIRRADG